MKHMDHLSLVHLPHAQSPENLYSATRWSGQKKPWKRGNKTRILVAFRTEYRVYQCAIASAIRTHRPHTQVAVAEPNEFEAEMERLDPHLVICSPPNAVPPDSKSAWVGFYSLDPEVLAAICLDGEYSESHNPGLGELLSIVDEAERLARMKSDPGAC